MRSRQTVVALIAIAALWGTACGDDESEASDPTTAAGGSDATTGSPGGDGAAGGDPIRIGMFNAASGQIAFPGYVVGADAATQYVNEELGGVDGRPIEIVHCESDGSPENGQSCGQQFANDDDMVMAMTGIVFNGAPFYEALDAAGTPVFGGLPVTDADFTSPIARFFYGGSPVANGGVGALIAQEAPDAEVVAVMHGDDAGGNAALEIVQLGLGDGIETVSIPTPSNAGDVLPQVTAMTDPSIDAIAIVVGIDTCLKVVAAFQTVAPTAPIFSNGQCVNPTVQDAAAGAGSSIDDWSMATYSTPVWVEGGSDDEVDFYNATFPNYSAEDPAQTFSAEGWGEVLTIHALLSSIDGELSTDSIAEAMDGFSGPVVLGIDDVRCPGPESFPTLCVAGSALAYRVEDGALAELGPVEIPFGD